ncbi:hypothetical protein ACHQM5_030183 [Ranunculus cassubicifolius]
MVGDVPTITLPKAVVARGKKYCEFALIGRLDFDKVSLQRVREIAAEVWKPTGEWKVIPLGRGFFMLRLESKDDYVRIWSQAWKVGDQVLYFSKWSSEFDIERQKSSNALVWVNFPRLGQQHWDYEALMRIGKGVGTPVGVDKKTISRDFGYFANVLIDVDFSKPIPEFINVREEDGLQFAQEVFIPKKPQFCTHCKSVGHGLYNCRGLLRVMQPVENNQTSRGAYNATNPQARTKQPSNLHRQEAATRSGTVVPAEVSLPHVQNRLATSLNAPLQSAMVSPAPALMEGPQLREDVRREEQQNIDVDIGNDLGGDQSGSGGVGPVVNAVGTQGEITTTENQVDGTIQQEGVINGTGVIDAIGGTTTSSDNTQMDGIVQQEGVVIEPDASPGEVQIPSNNASLNTRNAFAALTNNVMILSPSDEVPAALAGIISEVELVNTRMADFLNGNSTNNQQTLGGRRMLGRGRGRGRTRGGLGHAFSAGQNRDEVSASSLGPRKSQRDISAP